MKAPIGLTFAALLAAGCSGSSQPVMRAEMRMVGNNFYMMGDPDCYMVREYIGEGRALCHRPDGTPTGVRTAMTTQQIQVYQFNQQQAQQRQAQARAERAALMQQAQQVSASIANSTPRYAPPPTPYVAPVALPTTNVIHCTSVSGGFMTTCR